MTTSENASQPGRPADRSDKIIAILGWIIALMLVLYAGLYLGRMEDEALKAGPGEKLLGDGLAVVPGGSSENGRSAGGERYLVIISELGSESDALDFISRNLGFTYIKPRTKPGLPGIHEVAMGVFGSHREALDAAKTYRDKGAVAYVEEFKSSAPAPPGAKGSPKSGSQAQSQGRPSEPRVSSAPDRPVVKPYSGGGAGSAAGRKAPASTSRPSSGSTPMPEPSPGLSPEPAETVKPVEPSRVSEPVKPTEPVKAEASSPSGAASTATSSDRGVPPDAAAADSATGSEPFRVKSTGPKVTDPEKLSSMFTVQTFSLSSRDNALEQAKKFEDAGYHVYLTTTATDPPYYRVRVGAWPDRAAAEAAATEIRDTFKNIAGALVIEGVLKK